MNPQRPAELLQQVREKNKLTMKNAEADRESGGLGSLLIT